MLRKEQNDLLTQTGPGTSMGQMFRSYWLPALLAEELPENDCPPVRVKLLSERLLAFRDSEGRYGLIDEFCAHRGVSLWFGRNEESGLRCPYHGWKYDVTGQCVDVPSEPRESGFCQKIKLKSYPLVERGPVLWTYMGPPDKQPPLPEWEFATVPAEQTFISKRLQECNWLQAMEGGIDSSHVSFLHRGDLGSDPLFKGAKGNQYNLVRHAAVFRGRGAAGRALYRRAPQRRERQLLLAHHAVGDALLHHDPAARRPPDPRPLLDPDRRRELLGVELRLSSRCARSARARSTPCATARACTASTFPGTYRPLANKDNDYLIDRAAQKAGKTFSGVAGFAMQDASLQESMGPICDRTKENLVSTDNGIIMARHRLMRAAKALADKGIMPPGVDPAHHKVRSAAVVLPPDQAFKDAAKEALTARPGVAQTTV